MNVGDEVTLTDGFGAHVGVVTTRLPDGMCSVKWSSEVTERIHESELAQVDAYEPDDPKHPTFRERLADLWDARPGK